MVKGLYTAYTGMINEQKRMDTLTNNLANVNTTGYKKEGATSQSFKDALAYKIKDKSVYNLTQRMGVMNPGVKIGENYNDFSEGAFHETDNTFDLALSDSGFFEIEFTDKAGNASVKYTRDGAFTLNINGALVTKDGDYVLDVAGNHITLDVNAGDTMIDRQGFIYQGGNIVAQIGTTDFERNATGLDYDYLVKYGENMYEAIDGAVEVPAGASIYSGYLEQSNVSPVSEMVEMIAVTRQYEANQRVIDTIDDTLEPTVNSLGRPS